MTAKRATLDQITRPYRIDASRLKDTLTRQGISEPVSVLYQYPAPGRVNVTVRVGRYFNDSHKWFVAEVL